MSNMGRKSKAQIKREVKAIVECKTLTEAYKVSHPGTSLNNARKNQFRMLKDPRIQEELEKILDASKSITITKENITKIIGNIIARWHEDKEKTADVLRALELVAKLVPDFATKSEIHSYQHMSEEELNAEIQRKYSSLFDGRN